MRPDYGVRDASVVLSSTVVPKPSLQAAAKDIREPASSYYAGQHGGHRRSIAKHHGLQNGRLFIHVRFSFKSVPVLVSLSAEDANQHVNRYSVN